MADMIISKSKTKETVSQCNVSGDFYGALDAKVRELIKAAEQRAMANGRKTVRPQDL
jgi:histone H3/H4